MPWFTTRRILHIATATAQRTLAWCSCGPVGGHQLRLCRIQATRAALLGVSLLLCTAFKG